MTTLRVPHYLTRDKKGFWFRMFVPLHLRPIIGRKVFKKSLHTLDAVVAAHRARGLAARYAWAFQAVGMGAMSGDKDALKAGLKALHDGTAEPLKVKSGPNGPEAEIEPHDTPDTIAAGMVGYGRALEAWERVEIEWAKSEAHFHSEAYQRAREGHF